MGMNSLPVKPEELSENIRKLISSKCEHYEPFFDRPEDLAEISKELKTQFNGETKTIRYDRPDGYLIAVIHDYTGMNCEVSGMAKGKWFHTSIYADLFGYIFKTLECKRITFLVDTDNQKCINLLEKGGCVRECKLRGVPRYLYSMIPEDFYGKASK